MTFPRVGRENPKGEMVAAHDRSGKAPGSKLQDPEKLQAPNTNVHDVTSSVAGRGWAFWSLGFEVYLELGV